MKNKKEEDKYFDVFAPYLERIEKKEREKNLHEIGHISFREIAKEAVDLAKREKKIGFFLGVEVFLTIILLLMLFGFLPWF